MQFQVFEGDIGEVVALESGEESESIIATSDCFAFFAGMVANGFWEIDSIVYLMDLLFCICCSGHIDIVVVEYRMLPFESLDVNVTSKLLWVEQIQLVAFHQFINQIHQSEHGKSSPSFTS